MEKKIKQNSDTITFLCVDKLEQEQKEGRNKVNILHRVKVLEQKDRYIRGIMFVDDDETS